MNCYYNEIDPRAAAWIRELQSEKLIPRGIVDERSIKSVSADSVSGFGRCHFFAGIAGWELALQLAGWPADRPVWTGSCPCQPYSAAGKGEGDKDPRNLWPDFFRLIRECRPQCVFGEQVEAAIRHGWLDRVCADLEGEGYTFGACILGAHSAGPPHIRQRLFWVAHTGHRNDGRQGRGESTGRSEFGRTARGMANSDGRFPRDRDLQRSWQYGQQQEDGETVCGVANTGRIERQRRADEQRPCGNDSPKRSKEVADDQRCSSARGGCGFWADSTLIHCRDGKARRIPTQPGLFPLAHGVSGRVGLLRGAGNAIVPQVAAEFIAAFLEL